MLTRAFLTPSGLPNYFLKSFPIRKSGLGYDADIDGFRSSASQNMVAQHATNLVSDVADPLETKECNLPIIFVVHSLGGLIVKAVCPRCIISICIVVFS